MLINYLLFLGYFIGIWVVEKNFTLGLLYYFSIIIIFQKYNRLEFFSNHSDSSPSKYNNISLANCNYNIPLYETKGEFITIDLDFYQLCNQPEEEEKKKKISDICIEEENDRLRVLLPKNPPLLSSLSDEKAIYIDSKIILSQKLDQQLKKGDKITIDGTPIDSEQIFTVVDFPLAITRR